MRVVFDTNVLVSYLFWIDSPIHPIIYKILRNTEVLRSTETFAELSEVVMRKKFDPFLSIQERELFLASFYDNTEHITITERINSCRDAKDNKFLELAICGMADMIITGDADLLILNPFRNIPIINPASTN